MVRDAKFGDIPGIVDLLALQFRKTHYFKDKTAAIDEAETKRLLVTAIQRHGHLTGGGCFIQVAETDGIIAGIIIGTLVRVYTIGDRLMATDLFWTASETVHPKDPERLMRNMIDWAWKSPHVIEVRVGVTSIIESYPERVGIMLERIGMQPYGLMYRQEREKP